MVKRKPHHALTKIKDKFHDPATRAMTSTALRSAAALGYTTDQIAQVINALTSSDFVKSEMAHSPPNSKVWHDSYRTMHGDMELYLKFAGETLVDLTLTSFKEA